MKFLVITNPTSNRHAPSKEIINAALEWIEKYQKDGILETVYSTIPRGMLMIANTETSEQLWDLLVSYPLYRYLSIKVNPLMNHRHVFEKTIEYVKNSE